MIMPGAKSPTQHNAIPAIANTFAFWAMTAPRNAEKLNNGPGIACATASPA